MDSCNPIQTGQAEMFSQLLSDSFPASSSETKARKTPHELDFSSTLILCLVSSDFYPVKLSGVNFIMGILVREMGSREKARS